MYVDVHKAIRRSHPAPKARVQRKDVMVKDAAVKDGKLVDLDAETDDGQQLQKSRTASISGRTDSPGILSSSPRTTLLMRRSSTGQDGKLVRTTIPVKANYEQIKDHLKHLGPSNPASNPKSTKVSSVKIKPGGGNQTRSGSVATEAPDHHADADGVNERTSLLRPPPNGNEQSQSQLPTYTSPLQSAVFKHLDTPTLLITPNATGKDVETSAQLKPVSSNVSLNGSSRSIVSSLTETGLDRQRAKRGYVRSGSITEIEVNTGGVRKFVLEATSSGEDEGGESSNASPTSVSKPLDDVKEDDGKSEDTGTAEDTEQANGDSSTGSKKKTRRKKRRGGK